MQPMIEVKGISKSYRLGARQNYATLREELVKALKAPFRALRRRSRSTPETLWALQDISFEVGPGEVLGVIGRNGAGKSTLLKILSRITEPTAGIAKVYGRMGSLLEVGTGFHGELTGRENIYLNGTILGMKKREIDRRFDEIVAFSEVERFLDTPVKHYSSGMYTRLAFSVAAHLEPEILVVDEVLAVGDAAFQRKCLGKMSDVARQGRTILFVSHNMSAIQQLTHSCLVLETGRLIYHGPTETAIGKYLCSSRELASAVYDVRNTPRRFPEFKRQVEFLTVEVAGPAVKLVAADEPIRLNALVRGNENVDGFRLSATIYRADGTPIGIGFGPCIHSIRRGEESALELAIAEHNLAPGQYHVGFAVGSGNHLEGHTEFDVIFDVCHFEVMPLEGAGGVQATWASVWGTINFSKVSSSECAAAVR